MKTNFRNGCLPTMVAAVVALVVASPFSAVCQAGVTTFIELVPLNAAGASDTATELLTPLDQVNLGDSFVVEVWARTFDPQGLSSVSTTIQFNPAIAVVSGVVHTMLFSELPNGEVDNMTGRVEGLSGSHLSTCADQVGVAPTWARVAILEMQTTGSGSLVVEASDTGLLAFGTAICGVGDQSPAQVAYGATTLTVINPSIPTLSQWGLIVVALLLLSAGTVTIRIKQHVTEVCT